MNCLTQYSNCLKALGLGLLASSLTAQSIVDEANEAIEQDDPASQFTQGERAPLLYEGELEDVGPQYLLVPGQPQHNWFKTVIDLQWFNTTNPTLTTDSNKRSADLMIATAQFGLTSPEKPLWGGRARFDGGYRYQYFEYGEITGDVEINRQAVSQNDFKGHTVFTDGLWQKGNWSARAGIRFTRLDNNTSGDNFYNEVVPTWGVERSFAYGNDTRITLAYDGAAHFTTSNAVFLIRDDFNDRVTNALSLRAICRLNSKLFFQPKIRANYAVYSDDPNGDREDLTLSAGVTLSYYAKPNLILRVFTNYQERDSNGVGIADYSNVDAGLGGSFTYRF